MLSPSPPPTRPAGWTAPIGEGKATQRQRYAFWVILALGAIVRFAALGKVPAGLNSDEASTGVEALSILSTGMDRWGNVLPIWFPAWGSGMNALYTYLAVPVIGLFGLNVTVLRAVGAAFGVLTLPVAYLAARYYFGRNAALLTLGLLALLPWHVMSSRWALDSNLAPLLFTLGLFTIGKALDAGGRWRILAFLPWAVAIYAYPVTMAPEAVAGAAILILFRRTIMSGRGGWIAGLALALIVALPFLMFLAKNQLGLGPFPFEGALPFSIPALAATRLSQIHESLPTRIDDNLIFLWSGFRDGAIWHYSRYFAPLTEAAPFLILAGVLALGWRSARERRPHVILIVVLSAAAPIAIMPLNVTRFGWFYVPALMLVADLIVRLARDIAVGRIVAAAAALYVAGFLLLFYPYYFHGYNDEILALDRDLGNGFRVGLEPALKAQAALAQPGEKMLVEIGTVHPYLYVLFYQLASIESFQATRRMQVEDGIYRVSSFDRYYFDPTALPPGQSYVFVARSNALPCASPQAVTAGALWTVGRCAETVRQ
jgi:4-amino-4-deoxy-L-arabinose transferase-like glycosyltransferase